jgi:hypothetical protein
VNPRRETFFDMLKFTFCPTFTIVSFIFFITMIEVIIYITTLIVTFVQDKPLNYNQFLGPNSSVLESFGMKDSYKIKCDA